MKSPRNSMNEASSLGSHFARCFRPGIVSGWENGLYGNRGLMQLDVKIVNFPRPGCI